MSIKLSPNWRVLRGTAFGLSQPAMLGSAEIVIPESYSFDALDVAMAALIDEAVPQVPPDFNGAQALLIRVLHWAGALQRQCWIPIQESVFVGVPGNGATESAVLQMAVPYVAPRAVTAALEWVVEVVNRFFALGDMTPHGGRRAQRHQAQVWETLRQYASQGINNFHFLSAAHRLGIPARAILPGIHCYGTGCRSRWLESTVTDRTSHIGATLAGNKIKTAVVLRQFGLPAPQHAQASSGEHAVQIARQLGFPVVVKPVDAERGDGVAAGLRSEAGVVAAFEAAIQFTGSVLVEKHFDGEDYRLTVFGDRVVKVEQRHAGGVVGDGSHTIEQLVALEQKTPRMQRVLRQRGKILIELDEEAMGLLAEHSLTPQSVPAVNRRVQLRRRNNISTGGTQALIATSDVHPDNAALAIRAAKALGLDFAGVDLLTPDISRSWLDVGGLICEVNAKPQIGVRTTPEIYEQILKELLSEPSQIPTHLIVCRSEEEAPGEQETSELMRSLRCNGLSTKAGVWVDGQKRTTSTSDGFAAAQTLLLDRDVAAALCVMTAQEIVDLGLPTARLTSARVHVRSGGEAPRTEAVSRALAMLAPNVETPLDDPKGSGSLS